MIFHPSRVKSQLLHKYIEQAFVELALLPACHREDVGLLALLHPQVFSAHQIECRQRGVEMKISGGGACLTVEEPRELFTVTEKKLDLETRGVEFHQFTTMQLRISREHSVILTEDTFTISRPLKSARLSSKLTMLTGYQGSNHPGKSIV